MCRFRNRTYYSSICSMKAEQINHYCIYQKKHPSFWLKHNFNIIAPCWNMLNLYIYVYIFIIYVNNICIVRKANERNLFFQVVSQRKHFHDFSLLEWICPDTFDCWLASLARACQRCWFHSHSYSWDPVESDQKSGTIRSWRLYLRLNVSFLVPPLTAKRDHGPLPV